MPRCGNSCGENAVKICSRCKNIYYCSKECQRVHWKIHKKSCKAIQTKQEAASAQGGATDSSNKTISEMTKMLTMMQLGRESMMPLGSESTIPAFHKEYQEKFPYDTTGYEKLYHQWIQEQGLIILEKQGVDTALNTFGTIEQMLVKRWRFNGPVLWQFLQSKPKLGDIFTGHPVLHSDAVNGYGVYGLSNSSLIFHTMRNTPVHQSVFEQGKTYVSVGFVDLHQLINAKFILQGDEDTQNKIKYIGYEMNEISVARSKIILELLSCDVPVENILQIWFSSCLSFTALSALQAICQTLSQNEEDFKLKRLFEFWSQTKINKDSAKMLWKEDIGYPQMKVLSNLCKKQDRIEYARYLLTGQIFMKEREKPLFGNTTMFKLPTGYEFHRKAEDIFFHTLSMNELCYSKSLISSVVERSVKGIQSLRQLLKDEKIEVTLKIQKFDESQDHLYKEIRSFHPNSIEWSNIPDYMRPSLFLDMAAKCSLESTVHTFHVMNWISLVFGANLVDYFPLDQVLGGMSLQDYNGKVQRKFKECKIEFNEKFSSVRSSQPFLHQEGISEFPMNICEDVLADKFKDNFIKFMFEGKPVELIEVKREPINVFVSCNTIVFITFKFLYKN